MRTSACAVELVDGAFRIEKLAPTISYGEHADCILVTARRSPDASAVRSGADRGAARLARAGKARRLGLARHARHLQRKLPARRRRPRRADPARALRPDRRPDHVAGLAYALGIGMDRHYRGRREPRAPVLPRPGARQAGCLAAVRVAARGRSRATAHDAGTPQGRARRCQRRVVRAHCARCTGSLRFRYAARRARSVLPPT